MGRPIEIPYHISNGMGSHPYIPYHPISFRSQLLDNIVKHFEDNGCNIDVIVDICIQATSIPYIDKCNIYISLRGGLGSRDSPSGLKPC